MGLADVPGPTSPIVSVGPRSALHKIAEGSYGHRFFAAWLGQVNALAHPDFLIWTRNNHR